MRFGGIFMFDKIKRRIWMLKNIFVESRYSIDGFAINLGKRHMLPMYQEDFCYYDRILPFLAETTNGNKDERDRWIIDIGANVGDTVAAMIKHTNANFLCVEPDRIFFGLLSENIEILSEGVGKGRIIPENAFVAMDTTKNLSAVRVGGTAHVIENNGAFGDARVVTLQELIKWHKIDFDHIDLIKIDTDGYDWQCLLSLGDILDNYQIPLYWENEMSDHKQYDGCQELAGRLHAAGYHHFFIFDNFGSFLSEGDCRLLSSINDYLLRMNENKTARTFYYVDVIAVKDKSYDTMKDMINKYLKETQIKS
jgi:FkbM family methyltransferase